MRLSISVFLVGLFTLLVSGTSHAQSLWQGTKIGMSVDQVRAVVPKAAPNPTEPGQLPGGEKELLRIEDFELVDEKFTVSFYFLEKKLTTVTLNLHNRTLPAASYVFERLIDSLEVKYGKETSRKSERIAGTVDSSKATWQNGQTTISLFLFGSLKGDPDAILNLSYAVTLAKEADKL